MIRTPTSDEKADYIDIWNKDQSKKKFYEDLAKAGQEAMKKGLPFAEKVAINEFNDYYKDEVEKSIRKNGYLETTDIKPIKMDWAKYSDLKSWDLIDEGEVVDNQLSKNNPGLRVALSFKKYKHKEYNLTCQVMEDSTKALKRAKG